jgi:hypothetical protein
MQKTLHHVSERSTISGLPCPLVMFGRQKIICTNILAKEHNRSASDDFTLRSLTPVQIVMQYKGDEVLPDPAFILTMGNVIAQDSNFYAVQKTFDGAFSFDVIFDSQSAGTDIAGELTYPIF